MGYDVQAVAAQIRIARAMQPQALEAIKALVGQETNRGPRGDAHFSFVRTEEFASAASLDEALAAWRWDSEFDDEGNIIDLMFMREKLGDEEILFKAIAPCVDAGSWIHMQGEDGKVWRWYFNGKQLIRQEARIVFDEGRIV